MTKKNIMWEFLKTIYDSKMMTKFIVNIFGYNNFNDYNYLFRLMNGKDEIIIDIYDNVSDSRFNRYIFSFLEQNYIVKLVEEKAIFIHYISILNVSNSDDKLLKLAYLFKIDKDKMIEYASRFLDEDFVMILKDIIK